MRDILFIFALLLSFISFGQKEVLYYFAGKDSCISVKTAKGKVVIPAIYECYTGRPGEKVIGEKFLLFDKNAGDDSTMSYSCRFKFFDRKGNYLYSPFFFDNGPDYFVEGLTRFVKNGKMGFADRFGKKVIHASYNYVDPFYCGYALVCFDCSYTRFSIDDEHCCGYAGTRYGIMNRAWAIVYEFSQNTAPHLCDSLLSALNLTTAYTNKEQSLIKVLQGTTEIAIYWGYHPNDFLAAIIESPKNQGGFYMIAFESISGTYESEFCFLISDDGKKIFHINSIDGGQESLAKWRH